MISNFNQIYVSFCNLIHIHRYNDVIMGTITSQITSQLFTQPFIQHRSNKTTKLRVTGLCAGNSPVAGEFPVQMASNAETVSIWWRHHVTSDPGLYPYLLMIIVTSTNLWRTLLLLWKAVVDQSTIPNLMQLFGCIETGLSLQEWMKLGYASAFTSTFHYTRWSQG